MEVKYLDSYNDIVFNVVMKKTVNGLKYQFLSIDPLAQYIGQPIDAQLLVNALSNYVDIVKSTDIKESLNSELILNQEYIIFETRQTGDNPIEFSYSEEFLLPQDDFINIQEKSIELAEIILSVIAANETTVNEKIEDELTCIARYDLEPIQEGTREVLGVLLTCNEQNDIGFTVRHYSTDNKPGSDIILKNMVSAIFHIVRTNLKKHKLFLIKQDSAIIKLGITTSGEYVFNTNPYLLSELDYNQQLAVQDLLINTHESI